MRSGTKRDWFFISLAFVVMLCTLYCIISHMAYRIRHQDTRLVQTETVIEDILLWR
jgi:hypothetical protein